MPNPWLEHVKKVKTQRRFKGKSYKEVLKAAALTYKKKGGTKTKKPKKTAKPKKCSKEISE